MRKNSKVLYLILYISAAKHINDFCNVIVDGWRVVSIFYLIFIDKDCFQGLPILAVFTGICDWGTFNYFFSCWDGTVHNVSLGHLAADCTANGDSASKLSFQRISRFGMHSPLFYIYARKSHWKLFRLVPCVVTHL